jgi:hypothetical protein
VLQPEHDGAVGPDDLEERGVGRGDFRGERGVGRCVAFADFWGRGEGQGDGGVLGGCEGGEGGCRVSVGLDGEEEEEVAGWGGEGPAACAGVFGARFGGEGGVCG